MAIILEPKICTSSPSVVSEAVLIVFPPLQMVTWSWQQSKRANQNLGRRSCLLSSSVKGRRRVVAQDRIKCWKHRLNQSSSAFLLLYLRESGDGVAVRSKLRKPSSMRSKTVLFSILSFKK